MLLKKIVVAEDDDAIAHLINMALGDAGYLCLRARDGDEAIRLVRTHTPDLLVLDVMMPRVDGLQVARTLRSDVLVSRTPILMLTALAKVEDKVDGLDAGADDYLTKPFDLREFGARVKALIRSSQRERERNPTTGLPGSGSIEKHLDEVLAGGEPMAVLHFDVCDFDAYADRVGFSRAERLVAMLGKLILDRTQAHTEGGAFVGHLGGVDFIATTRVGEAEALAREVIEAYEREREDWLPTDDDKSDSGRETIDTLIITLEMAVALVITEGLGDGDGAALADRMAAAMRASKQREGSNYVVWNPEIA